jgi:hypothetical protein
VNALIVSDDDLARQIHRGIGLRAHDEDQTEEDRIKTLLLRNVSDSWLDRERDPGDGEILVALALRNPQPALGLEIMRDLGLHHAHALRLGDGRLAAERMDRLLVAGTVQKVGRGAYLLTNAGKLRVCDLLRPAQLLERAKERAEKSVQ